MGVSRLGQRTDDIVWDEGHENDFFRRMPSALSLALEATDLESLARATAKGAEVLWECGAEVVLPSEGELRRKIQATALNGARRPAGFRHNGRAAALRMPLIAHDARLGELVLRRERPFGRQERGHVQYYAELCALAVHSCFMREQFHRAAVTDPLTGIANRRRLMDELEHRTGGPYRLLMLDADGLKQVNDSLGYEDGDLLIVALADTLASVLEPGELAARLGGDELVAVLNALAPADASARVHRLRVLVDDLPLPRRIRDICQGASVGCVGLTAGRDAPRDAPPGRRRDAAAQAPPQVRPPLATDSRRRERQGDQGRGEASAEHVERQLRPAVPSDHERLDREPREEHGSHRERGRCGERRPPQGQDAGGKHAATHKARQEDPRNRPARKERVLDPRHLQPRAVTDEPEAAEDGGDAEDELDRDDGSDPSPRRRRERDADLDRCAPGRCFVHAPSIGPRVAVRVGGRLDSSCVEIHTRLCVTAPMPVQARCTILTMQGRRVP